MARVLNADTILALQSSAVSVGGSVGTTHRAAASAFGRWTSTLPKMWFRNKIQPLFNISFLLKLILHLDLSLFVYFLHREYFLVWIAVLTPLSAMLSRYLPRQSQQSNSVAWFATTSLLLLYAEYPVIEVCRTFRCALTVEAVTGVLYVPALVVVPVLCGIRRSSTFCSKLPSYCSLALLALVLWANLPLLVAHRFHTWACQPLNVLRSGPGPVLENFVRIANDYGRDRYFIFKGALLAVARNGKMTEWDADIDVYVAPDLWQDMMGMDPDKLRGKYGLQKYLPTCDNTSCKITMAGGDYLGSPSGYVHFVLDATPDYKMDLVPCDLKAGDYLPVLVKCPSLDAMQGHLAALSYYALPNGTKMEKAKHAVANPQFDQFGDIANK